MNSTVIIVNKSNMNP